MDKLSRGERIIGIAGILLAFDLLFLPWYSYSFGPISYTFNGLSGWNSSLGSLALLVTAAMVAYIIVARFTTAKLPDLPIPWSQALMYAGYVAVALVALKLVLHFGNTGFGAYLGVIFGAVVAFGGFTVSQESAKAGSAG